MLVDRYQEKTREAIREALIEEAIRDLGIDEKTDDLLTRVRPTPLVSEIRTALDRDLDKSWEKPLDDAAAAAAEAILAERA